MTHSALVRERTYREGPPRPNRLAGACDVVNGGADERRGVTSDTCARGIR